MFLHGFTLQEAFVLTVAEPAHVNCPVDVMVSGIVSSMSRCQIIHVTGTCFWKIS